MSWNYTNEPPWKAVQIKGFWRVTTDRGDPSDEYDVESSGDEEVARLQAAAPALLAACEKGRAWFKSETALEEIGDVIKSFDEAIKAAKGGTHVDA